MQREYTSEILKKYYQETEPLKRKKYLEESIKAGEQPEENQIRLRIWTLRYQEKSKVKDMSRADGYLKLWMNMKFAAGSNLTGWFSGKRIRRELNQQLEQLGFYELRQQGETAEKLLCEECRHAANLYLKLCKEDKNYNSALLGLMSISQDSLQAKIARDIYVISRKVPKALKMEEEFWAASEAVKEVFLSEYPQGADYLKQLEESDQ